MNTVVDRTRPTPQGTVDALALENVSAGYGRTTVLRNIDLAVPAGSVLALLGANGAGKTTLLRCAAGLTKVQHGRVRISGSDHSKTAPHQRLRAGLCLIPEGRGIWRSLTVRENLKLQSPPWLAASDAVDKAVEAFPALRSTLDQQAGTLSGGQQQMVALSRAYLSGASTVLLDEVSMGLAPRIVDEIFASIDELRNRGMALVVVEQYVERALEIADRMILLRRGEVVFSGRPDEIDQEALVRSYLGQGESPVAEHAT